mmetsp:Transcript_11921/g.27824  ORF Transcript_11921/g.27824 Transcript_11921/m.27824 type:complete len:690 (-) Transcript_11921:80-2149(-)
MASDAMAELDGQGGSKMVGTDIVTTTAPWSPAVGLPGHSVLIDGPLDSLHRTTFPRHENASALWQSASASWPSRVSGMVLSLMIIPVLLGILAIHQTHIHLIATLTHEEILGVGQAWQRRLTTTLCETDVNADEEPVGTLYYLEPSPFISCLSSATSDVTGNNRVLADLSIKVLDGYEVFLLSEVRNGLLNFEVQPEANGVLGAHYTFQSGSQPSRVFGSHSCLNSKMFCDLTAALPLPEGFATLDHHRLQIFRYDWFQTGSTLLAEEDEEETEEWLCEFGVMNLLGDDGPNETLSFPIGVAEYRAFVINNSRQETVQDQEDSLSYTPHWRNRFFLVTDTGHHRVVVLNATNLLQGQLEYVLHFGVTGQPRMDEFGVETPWGIAVYMPAWEARYAPVLANVYVTDRTANRLLKLNLGYRDRESTELELMYSGEYNEAIATRKGQRRLNEPMGVACFRHYIVVAEGAGNVVSVLMVNYTSMHEIEYVTYFTPVLGTQLSGSITITPAPYGYTWYTATEFGARTNIANFRIPRQIRLSDHPDVFEDFVTGCLNATWYNSILRYDDQLYEDHVRWVLDGALIENRISSREGYVNIYVFNTTAGFDFSLFNETIWASPMAQRLDVTRRSIEFCGDPPEPTPPPMSSGDEDGWIIDGVPAAQTWLRAASCRCEQLPSVLLWWGILALWTVASTT